MNQKPDFYSYCKTLLKKRDSYIIKCKKDKRYYDEVNGKRHRFFFNIFLLLWTIAYLLIVWDIGRVRMKPTWELGYILIILSLAIMYVLIAFVYLYINYKMAKFIVVKEDEKETERGKKQI